MTWRTFAASMRFVTSLMFIALAGCATYHPVPLPSAPDLSTAPSLTVPAKQFLLPGLSPHPIPAHGLDRTTVEMLAVFNDPALKAARLQAGVANAQVLEAGLLPDPQLSAGYERSVRNYGGALSLSEDIQALVTRGARKAAAKATRKQIHLSILWKEWQVAAQASQLFIQIRSGEQVQHVLRKKERLLAHEYQTDRAAMQRGDETSTVVSADLMRLSNAQDSLRKLQSSMNMASHQLDELLGLKPGIHPRLVASASFPAITKADFRAAIAALPHRRADLLALKAGYHSQEEKVRKAILAQFPAMSAGLEMNRDPVEGVNSFGPQVNLTLPLFNRNRGHIAIQRVTRTVMRQTYQSRLDSAENQAHELWRANHILAAQLRDLDRQLPILKQRAAAAKRSLQQNNLDAGAYVVMESDYLTKQAKVIRVSAALQSARSALHILLGLPL